MLFEQLIFLFSLSSHLDIPYVSVFWLCSFIEITFFVWNQGNKYDNSMFYIYFLLTVQNVIIYMGNTITNIT